MGSAVFEPMPHGSWWGSIPGFKGLWSEGPTRDLCRDELRSALEDWIVFSLRRGGVLPVVDGIDLNVTDVA